MQLAEEPGTRGQLRMCNLRGCVLGRRQRARAAVRQQNGNLRGIGAPTSNSGRGPGSAAQVMITGRDRHSNRHHAKGSEKLGKRDASDDSDDDAGVIGRAEGPGRADGPQFVRPPLSLVSIVTTTTNYLILKRNWSDDRPNASSRDRHVVTPRLGRAGVPNGLLICRMVEAVLAC